MDKNRNKKCHYADNGDSDVSNDFHPARVHSRNLSRFAPVDYYELAAAIWRGLSRFGEIGPKELGKIIKILTLQKELLLETDTESEEGFRTANVSWRGVERSGYDKTRESGRQPRRPPRNAFMHFIAFAAYFWSFAYALFVVPGTLIGWLLRRYVGRRLVAILVAEAFVLLACVDGIIKEGFEGPSHSLV